jgi:hypothetical protein
MAHDDIRKLTALFRKLGAREPESWASSQINDGIDQLARFVFLREAWQRVVPPEDVGWIDDVIASSRARPNDPGSGAGPALTRMLAAGVQREDIHEVVRVMQWEVLAGLCYLLEDPGTLEPEVQDLMWRLVRTDEDDEVVGEISGLHESVLETDPSGREMRPRTPG